MTNANEDRAATRTSVSLDADLVEALKLKADVLERELGFRPTMSQTLRYLLREVDSGKTPARINAA